MLFVIYFMSVAMLIFLLFFFFFNDTATTEIYTLSLHDALRSPGEESDEYRRLPTTGRDVPRSPPHARLARRRRPRVRRPRSHDRPPRRRQDPRADAGRFPVPHDRRRADPGHPPLIRCRLGC